MKNTDYSLPEEQLEEVKAAEVVIAMLKPQLRNPNSATMLAYAKLTRLMHLQIEDARRVSVARVNTDNPEASLAAGSQ